MNVCTGVHTGVHECVGRIHVWPPCVHQRFGLISCVPQQLLSCVHAWLIYGRGERYVNIHSFLRVDSAARQGSVKCPGCALINTSDKSSPLISAHHDHHSPLLPSPSSSPSPCRRVQGGPSHIFLTCQNTRFIFPVGHFVLQTVTNAMHRPNRRNTAVLVARLHVKIVPISGKSSETLHSTWV